MVREFTELIRDGAVVLIGSVRQEILSGVPDEATFARLRDHLRHFEDEQLTTEDYETAAECNNRCRAAGIAGSAIDFLICAAAIRRGLSIFTTDPDFELYETPLSITLHRPRRGKR